MQLHQLKPTSKLKKRKRVGRGGKRGTYSGRGLKGQKARAGKKLQPIIRQLIKRYPKKRGYRFKGFKPKPEVVNVGLLEKKFPEKAKINPEILLKNHLVRRIEGKVPKVKILGKGKITKALIIENCSLSKKAEEKIEKAGGKINLKNRTSKVKKVKN